MTPDTQKRINAWVFGALIPGAYLIIELGFNHRLVGIASGSLDREALSGLEFWGRVLSGSGLGLFFFRLALGTAISRVLLLLMSLITGILVMWNLQVALADYLVRSATEEDKSVAMALFQVAPQVTSDELRTLKGESMISPGMSSFESHAMRILFPAASLHIENRSTQLENWISRLPAEIRVPQSSWLSPDEAYRNLIILPIALGMSILFAVLNMSVLVVFLFHRGSSRRRSVLNAVVFSLLVALSALAGRGFVRSDGYLGSMRSGIWQEKPLLALLVEWSGSAPQFWSGPSAFISQTLLVDVGFKKPSISF